jgi:hypothetical protein
MYSGDPSSKPPYPLKGIMELEGGVLQSERNTNFPQGNYLVLSKSNGKTRSGYLMSKRAYESSFSQLFILGKPDDDRFEEIVNLFPLMRLFKVKSYGASAEDKIILD